jgi:hypothetical protein
MKNPCFFIIAIIEQTENNNSHEEQILRDIYFNSSIIDELNCFVCVSKYKIQ